MVIKRVSDKVNCPTCGFYLALCPFKIRPICRLRELCIYTGFGVKENNINRCTVYWNLVAKRAAKRLRC